MIQVENKNEKLEAIDLDAAISHHGIEGMRWGIWNEETRRKYLGLSRSRAAMEKFGKNAKIAANKIGSSASEFMKSKAAKHKVNKNARIEARKQAKVKRIEERNRVKLEEKQKKEEIRQHRKETGLSPDEFHALRKKTLMSHDPEVVMKGMKTLTDKELADKINRLQQEAIIERIANDYSQHASRKAEARAKAIAANPIVQIGSAYATAMLDQSIKAIFGGKKGGGKNQKNQKNQNDQDSQNNTNEQERQQNSNSERRSAILDQARSIASNMSSLSGPTAEARSYEKSFEEQQKAREKARKEYIEDALKPRHVKVETINPILLEPPKQSYRQQEKARKADAEKAQLEQLKSDHPVLFQSPQPSYKQQERISRDAAKNEKLQGILNSMPLDSGLSREEMEYFKLSKSK